MAEGNSDMSVVADMPDWLNPLPWVEIAQTADVGDVQRALRTNAPGVRDLAALLSSAAADYLEPMAQRALTLTRRHFGRTISLYAPLYLSNYCNGGCAYCGFAADRMQERSCLNCSQVEAELLALKAMGFEDVLLLTGERCPQADFDYLFENVRLAAQHVHNVSVEAFAMTQSEYAALSEAGCMSVTLYQETYDPDAYAELHRWGEKQDYLYRLDAPARALAAGIRTVGIGALLGLSDPRTELICLYRHLETLRREHWRSGVMVSFPRLCDEQGHYTAPYPVDDRQLAQYIYAFRICLPDVPLVLSTRERAVFRDGLAGVGICRMSAASRTTVGGYLPDDATTGSQFDVSDTRDIYAFCSMLRAQGLDPVFKNWDAVFAALSEPQKI